jgi:hypothetical protein
MYQEYYLEACDGPGPAGLTDSLHSLSDSCVRRHQ